MFHRVRVAMATGTLEMFEGPLEVDRTFIGEQEHARLGLAARRAPQDEQQQDHRRRSHRARLPRHRQGDPRHPAEHARRPMSTTTRSSVCADGRPSYAALHLCYGHTSADHSGGEHVVGAAHTARSRTSGPCSSGRCTAPTLCGALPPVRHLDERMFSYTERHRYDQGRFLALFATVSGRRLTYAKLTGKV